LLKCVNQVESMRLIEERLEGLCGAHRTGLTMKWLIIRHEYYWPMITSACYRYAKRCEECQRFGPLQNTPVEEMHVVVKPWPFRG